MNDLSLIAAGTGIHDGLNPCVFMTSAVLIALGEQLRGKFLQMARLRVLFVLVYAFSSLMFLFGPGQLIVFQKNFVTAAKFIYFGLSVWALVGAWGYLKLWYHARCGKIVHIPAPQTMSLSKVVAVCLGTVFLAVLLSALSSLWPLDKYTFVLGTEAIIKGQWKSVAPMLGSYVLSSMWALWLVWFFLSVKNVRMSLYYIVCSAIFLVASSCIILSIKGVS